MFNLDHAITNWRRQMKDAGVKAAATLDELESHLRDDAAQQVRNGLSEEDAWQAAAARIGEVATLTGEFKQVRKTAVRQAMRGMGVMGATLITGGFLVGYFLVLPLALGASVRYAEFMGMAPAQNPASGFWFMCRFMAGLLTACAMPFIALTLVKIGRLTSRQLTDFRMYAIGINLLLGAMLTTPEMITQLLMFIPLQLMWELSVWLARRAEKQGRTYA